MTSDQDRVLDIIAQVSPQGRASLCGSQTLTEIGLDSLKFITIIVEIEQALGRHIFDIDNVGQLRTLDDLLHLVHAPASA